MKNFKKVIAALLCSAMVFGLVACGDNAGNSSNTGSSNVTDAAASGSTETATSGDAKNIICSEQPENGEYDPAGATAYVYFDLQSYCLEGLIDYDEEGTVIPAAATSWEANEDGSVWTFHLKEDGYWSDGSKVTSADFLNTITRALDPAKGAWYVDALFLIKGASDAFNGTASIDDIGVECPDDLTIIFTLASPCANFLDYVRLPVYMPSNVTYATNADEGWDTDVTKNLGNGPYHMSDYKSGEYITFAPNEYYSDRDAVKFDTLTFKFMDDDQAKTSAYKTGEIDILSGAPYYVEDQYADQADLQSADVLVTNYILFNINMAPFDDVRVRQAFALAVSRQGICDVIGSCYTPSTTFVAANYKSKVDGTKWSDLQGALLDENIEAAKQLLADAGYPNGEGLPTITYTYPSMSYEADVAQVLQAQWQQLGVTVELNAMEYEVYVDARRAGELQLARHQWTGDYNDPATWLDMYRDGNSQNDISWLNDEYNQIMTESASEMDTAARQALLQEAEKILVSEDTVICPLFTTKSLYLVNPSITGQTNYVMGYLDFRFADITQ